MTGDRLTHEDLPPYVRVVRLGHEPAGGSRLGELRLMQVPWRRGAFHTVRHNAIAFLAFAMVGGASLAQSKGSSGPWSLLIALAFLMGIGNLFVATHRPVLVLTAHALTLQRGLFLAWDKRQFALRDAIAVHAQTRLGEREQVYFLEVIAGLKLAAWGDFASLEDAARVATLVRREVDVLQGRDAASKDRVVMGQVLPDLPPAESTLVLSPRRLTALALIGLGATLVLFGVLVTAVAIVTAVTRHELRYPLMLIVPLGMTLLGAVLIFYGIRVRRAAESEAKVTSSSSESTPP